MRTQPSFSGFKDQEMGPQTKECRWPVETRNGKEIDSPLESLVET